jgi:hypothetical protein
MSNGSPASAVTSLNFKPPRFRNRTDRGSRVELVFDEEQVEQSVVVVVEHKRHFAR